MSDTPVDTPSASPSFVALVQAFKAFIKVVVDDGKYPVGLELKA